MGPEMITHCQDLLVQLMEPGHEELLTIFPYIHRRVSQWQEQRDALARSLASIIQTSGDIELKSRLSLWLEATQDLYYENNRLYQEVYNLDIGCCD